jgi:hypothetical protein
MPTNDQGVRGATFIGNSETDPAPDGNLARFIERDLGWVQDLLVFLIIIVSGVFAGWGGWLLGSTIHTKTGETEISGAVAGLLVIWPALVTVFLKLRKLRQAHEDSGIKRDFEKLQAKHDELKQKLIRSAPCPRGYKISLDENQKLILARPAEWTSRGGVIFDFDGASSTADILPARFLVHYYPIEHQGNTQPNAQLHEHELREAHYNAIARHFEEDTSVRVVTKSRTYLGGDTTPIECLRLVMRGYHKIAFKKDAVTGRTTRDLKAIHQDEFEELPTYDVSAASAVASENWGEGQLEEWWGEETEHTIVRCYHYELRCVYSFELFDNLRDISESSKKFERALLTVRFLA